ncbi:MAG: serine/threonine protein kinase, partial [Myxococcales bacterium]|nr:serine/threonine protein kinase [Myxococcales bacterium]
MIEREAVLRRVASRLFDAEPRAPVRVDRYEIIELIGAGGMGHVYAARDPQLDRTVALKLLPPGFADDAGETARLRQEARTLARLAHPNIVHVYEFGRAGERSYVAMEYVGGPTLRELQRSAADWRTILALYLDAARGLIAAHEAGVVHRDFKPANVLVSRGMHVRVADFGIARVSREGDATGRASGAVGRDQTSSTAGAGSSATAGTPAYMSPEQLAGVAVGPASDQFSYC